MAQTQKPQTEKTRSQRYLLVDFENVQRIDVSKIESSVRVIVFLGANQTKLSVDLVIKSQKFGSRLEWKQIEGSGQNALDFVIAYHLGKVFDKDPKCECTILSKDKGFDPLIAMLKKEGRICSRIESIAALG